MPLYKQWKLATGLGLGITKNWLYGSRWQTDAVPKSSKNNLEASKVVNMPVAPWAPADQRLRDWTGMPPYRHSMHRVWHLHFKIPKKKKNRPQGSLLKTAGDKKLRKLLLSCPAHGDRRDPSSPSQLQPAELLPGNVHPGQITRKNNTITGYVSMLNLI